MLAESILQRLEAEFDSPPETIRAVAGLLDEGASPEFIALYRRDETGDPGEERVVALAERLRSLQEIESRRETLLQFLEMPVGEGMTAPPEGLRDLISGTVDQEVLDDVDHALRPAEHKSENRVRELGLGDLFDRIARHELGDDDARSLASELARDEDGVRSADEVLAQIVLALGERYGEDPVIRQRIRAELSRGILKAGPKGGSRARGTAPVAEVEAVAPAGDPATDPASGAPETPSAGDAVTEGGDAASRLESAESTAEPGSDPAPQDAGPATPAAGSEFVGASESDSTAEAGSVGVSAAGEDAPEPPAAEQAAADQVAADQAAAGQAAAGQAAAGQAAEALAEPAPAADPDRTEHREPTEPRRERRERKGSDKKRQGGGRYADLLDLEEPVRRIPANRMLALRRAEREGILELRLVLPAGRELELFRERFSPDVAPDSQLGRFLDLLYGHAYDQHVHRACEQSVRHKLKEKADRETVRAFARSLRAQLMTPVLNDAPVAAARVSGKSAWFCALDAAGTPTHRLTMPVPDTDEGRVQLHDAVREAIQEAGSAAIAIPHGRRERAAMRMVKAAIAGIEGEKPLVVPVDETASIVWATSASARKRHSQADNGLRTTLSLARRLRDPLFELIRVEPRGLGLGQHFTEVHQGLLKRQLDATASSCLAHIGIDVNRADPSVLARLPGVSQSLAKAITQARSKNGPYTSLEKLREVEGIDEATWRHVVGFLRIHGGEEPLDATPIHPEDYPLARRIAERAGVAPEALPEHDLGRLEAADYDATEIPRRFVQVVQALRAGAGDPRGKIESFQNEGIAKFEDLAVDRQLRGRVTNLAEFGAFIDLGVGQDGLIHLSQIPGSRLKDPDRILKVGEILTVWVVSLDPKGHKIGLSMMKPRHLAEGRSATLGERMGDGNRRGRGRGRGPGRGRGRDEGPEVQTRAARVPEGRRGQRRGPKPKTSGNSSEGAAGLFEGRREGPRERRGRGGPDKPRVMTFESERANEESRGHKGELRSLSSLRNLLGGGSGPGPSEPPKDGGATPPQES